MDKALTAHQDFSGSGQTMSVVETVSSAIAAQSKAMVESRYVMAMRSPRNWDTVRQDLIRECRRPSFAHNKSAYYIKPIGDGVEGLGIRFVEVALRCMRNVLVETTMIFEDTDKEVHRVSVTDLEANITYPLDVRVSKTVERSKPNGDGSYISVRKNSYGKNVYTITGTDDDLLNKRGALISKAIRTLGLRIIPGDLCDEAEEIIKRIRLDEAAKDPDAERKKIADAFFGIGVSVIDLAEYLGHDISKCSPAQIVTLRGLYGAIKDGESTWQSVLSNKAEQAGETKESIKTISAEEFTEQFTKWKAIIESGKQTPANIISTVRTKNTLTGEQVAAIMGIKAAPGTATAKVTDDAPKITFAIIADRLNKAKDLDMLAADADLIGSIKNQIQREELDIIYNARKEELNN